MSKTAKKSLDKCETAIDAYLWGFAKSSLKSQIKADNPTMHEVEVEEMVITILKQEGMKEPK